MINFETRFFFRRLYLAVVFFFIGNTLFSQSKKDQIDLLLSQRDSLLNLTLLQDKQLNLLNQIDQERSALVKNLEIESNDLSNLVDLKNKEINELQLQQNCLTASNYRTVETISGMEPALIETCQWNGFMITLEKEGDQETYPNRLYGFEYEFENVSTNVPMGVLFNENRSALEQRLNELVKAELIKNEILPSEIIHYYFPIKDHDSGDGAIMFFIDHNVATFYFWQFMYGLDGRLEIKMPLHEINEYLIDVKQLSLEDKRKRCSHFEIPILIEVSLKGVELGDASYYVEFVDPNTLESFNFSFSNWLFEEQDIYAFCEKYWVNGKVIEKEFMLELTWTKVSKYEYRGFDEGNVDTGEVIDAWSLVSIYPGWTDKTVKN
jgi:hypothetical protein